jgi:hypothetical protein
MCGIFLAVAVFIVLLAVLGVGGLAFYMGGKSKFFTFNLTFLEPGNGYELFDLSSPWYICPVPKFLPVFSLPDYLLG